MAVMNPYNYAKPKNFIKVDQKPMIKSAKSSSVNDKMDQYLESKIHSAKPEELTLMLYEGLVKFIKKAMLHLENKEFEKVNNNTQRAQAIVDELRSTLNMDIEISKDLDNLYEFLSYNLTIANIEKNEEAFNQSLEIAEGFRDTWKSAFGIKS